MYTQEPEEEIECADPRGLQNLPWGRKTGDKKKQDKKQDSQPTMKRRKLKYETMPEWGDEVDTGWKKMKLPEGSYWRVERQANLEIVQTSKLPSGYGPDKYCSADKFH